MAQAEANAHSESGGESSSGSGSESGSGNSSASDSESKSGSSSSGSSDSESESGKEAAQISAEEGRGFTKGLNEDEIMALAQVESPNAAVKLTPQVHVQVTRVGHNTN